MRRGPWWQWGSPHPSRKPEEGAKSARLDWKQTQLPGQTPDTRSHPKGAERMEGRPAPAANPHALCCPSCGFENSTDGQGMRLPWGRGGHDPGGGETPGLWARTLPLAERLGSP